MLRLFAIVFMMTVSHSAFAVLNGHYSIGPSGQFATLRQAVDSLNSQGISGPVTFSVAPGTQTGPIALTSFPGSGDFNVTFAPTAAGFITVVSSDTSQPVIRVTGTKNVQLKGFAANSVSQSQPALRIDGNSTEITIHQGNFSARATSRVIEIVGTQVSGVRVTECGVRRGGDGIFISSPAASSQGHRIESCVIDSVLRGIVLERQTDCSIERCIIKPNSGSGSGATGIHVGPQNESDSVSVQGNVISQIRTTGGYATAIRHAPLNNSSRLTCMNNIVHSFQNTGSSQVRALFFTGGRSAVINNSVLVNDVTSTGTTYTVYNGLTSPDASLTLLNNIFVNREATRPSYNVFILTSAGSLTSNNNLFHGTGSSYRLGWYQTEHATLNAWSSATGQDLSSYVGDPQFVSDTDLHLRSSSSLPHQNGAIAKMAGIDIDGEPRFQPPDIGADEYTYDAPPFDAAVLSVLDAPAGVPEYTTVTIHVLIQNRGSQPLVDLPIRLSANGSQLAETQVTIFPSVADSVALTWETGAAGETLSPVVEVVLPEDSNPANNSRSFTLHVTAAALSGTYRVGGTDSDFASIAAALGELSTRGVSGPVTFELSAGDYSESIHLQPFPGMGAQHPLTIRRAPSVAGSVVLMPGTGEPVVRLTGVTHVTFEDLTFACLGLALEIVRLENGSSHNTLRNCVIHNASHEQVTSSGIALHGGCHNNLIENCSVVASYTGILLEGEGATHGFENVIRNCTLDSIRTGISAIRQHRLNIEQCDVRAGYPGAPGNIHAIRIGSLAATDTIVISRNKLFGGTSSGTLYGLYSEPASGTVIAANNWIGNFDSTSAATVTAISCRSGTTVLWHNSIEIGNLSAPSAAIVIALSGSQTALTMRNNILRVRRTNGIARMFDWSSGVLDSDYNLFETPGTNPEFRFANSSLDENWQTLAAWTTGTQQDSSSITSQAGFVSATDYHVRPDAFGPSNRGIHLPQVTTDFDGEPRDSVPDLGADEYNYLPAIVDIAVNALELETLPLPSGATTTVYAMVENVGQLFAPLVSAELRYEGVVLGMQTIDLPAGEVRELTWEWDVPESSLMFGSLEVSVSTAGDAVPFNNTQTRSVVIAGVSLSGQVLVGAGGQFPSLSQLAAHLKWRGISADVTVGILPGTYTEKATFDAIPGAGVQGRVMILPALPNTVTLTAANSSCVLELRGTEYLEFRDLNIQTGAGTSMGVRLFSGASYNVFSNCTVSGPGEENLGGVGLQVLGTGCLGNVVEQCDISNFYTGVSLTGSNYDLSRDNQVKLCRITDAYYGVWLDHQRDVQVYGNEILPGSSTGPANACYGIYILQLGTGGSARIEGNRIHGFRDSSGPRSNRASGVYSAPGLNASVDIVNNFIYGFGNLVTLRVRAIYLSSGEHFVANNSIHLDDTPANNDMSGIFISTGAEHELYNNCIVTYESNVPAYGLELQSGAAALSDFNCLWGNSTQFKAAISAGTVYQTLGQWQTTGQDANSIAARPRYVSATDLHLMNDDTVCYDSGISLPEVTLDIDGESRAPRPCIGADEIFPSNSIGPPVGLTIVCVDGAEYTLSWEAVPSARLYHVYAAESHEELQTSPYELGVTEDSFLTVRLEEFGPAKLFFHVRAQ
ncbi:right-handed parallel beta-helix repeat-containing protein [bacterium]|nr:right-handed parallel beta-helix repeat-containing protein [bacterium]